ncbi:MAG TPA: 16S rRNA (cytosine(1402)-N(4))-methyltransferase RsmH [Terriglobales bacterium]|nr:16S rRNA (cytosine(1402)-N(4))-methyltransferase RsmH [Terriglobales bacterium]
MKKSRIGTIYHKPVLKEKVIEYLIIDKSGTYVDATVGTGGHAASILEQLNEGGKLLGTDKDNESIKIAEERLRRFEKKVEFFNQSYSHLPEILKSQNVEKIRGVLFDLGLSSYQLDTPERGFSYSDNGPLDMRFDQQNGKTAFKVINNYTAEELTRVFKEYGEERFSKKIAQAIIQNRKFKKIESTKELKDIVKSIIKTKIDMKTLSRVFQALRIEVNNELSELKKGLDAGVEALVPGGRVCVISYHSLEDRIVKNRFSELAKGCTCPPDFPVCTCGGKKILKVLTRKPVIPDQEEIEENPRARSAKMRVAEKIE